MKWSYTMYLHEDRGLFEDAVKTIGILADNGMF